MKLTAIVSLTIALFASGLAFAQSAGMNSMGMKDMDMQKCMDMKDSNMKGMDMQKCQEMMNHKDMKDMDKSAKSKSPKSATHRATAVVKSADPEKGTVTLAHDPVKSLNWPAMTMGFKVKDKSLFDKLAADKKVHVEFMQQGSDYVVTSVK